MVIRASSGRQVDALLADLASTQGVTRDAAVARLIVIGPRAVQRLAALAVDRAAVPSSRTAALHALEGIGDQSALPALTGIADDPEDAVAVAAVGALQPLLQSPRGVEVIDRLTTIALDGARPRIVRLAAIRALSGLQSETLAPLLHALGGDDDPTVALAARIGPADARTDPVQQIRDAIDGALPDDVGVLRVALTGAGEQVPLPLLHQLIEKIRFHEGALTGEARSAWTALRASAHLQLAQRGSRLALYDLRETLESAREPLPVEFLAAADVVGDASCIEPLAAAYAHAVTAGRPPEDWWRLRVADVFRMVVRREGVTRRHAAGKRVAARWAPVPLPWP